MKKLIIVLLSLLPSAVAQQQPSSANPAAQHQAPPEAREELNAGVKAYREAHYESAIEHFQRAVDIDNDLCVAHLYLATALAQEYVPGAESEENVANGNKAVEQYQATLRCQPAQSLTPLKGMAYLKMNMKRLDESRDLYRQALKQDDKDPELYYSIGVIDWTQTYKNTSEEKSRVALSSNESLILGPFCRALRERNLSLVEDGMQMLTQAIALRQDYDDAMVYMDLLYQQRAEIDCGDPAARKADQKKAVEWSDLAFAARKKKAEAAKKSN